MSALLDRLGVELPVVQAGMGGIARAELAAAVSEAGGLGTIGHAPPEAMAAGLAAARERTSRPVAVNLLLPFLRRGHAEAVAGADLLVTHWGRPRRVASVRWLHQCGSVGEVMAARAAGADGVIVQGVEAGGHGRGRLPALELLAQTRAAVPRGYPVLVAGGVAEAADVRAALDAGADAAVLGTRFVLSDESRAHPAYQDRLLAADETVRTELFGVGWPAAPHRVVPNEATRRWLARDPRGPVGVRAVNGITRAVAVRLGSPGLAARQRPGVPFFSPYPPTVGGPQPPPDAAPLYAGETVARISDISPAGELVRALAGERVAT